jgi:CheY-like chemotaxis protein
MSLSPCAPPELVDVLIVDDEATIRAVIRDILEAEGFRVAEASDGRDALAVLARRSPAVILLDLQMPRMDGWALYQQLRAEERAIPVVFVTAGAGARVEAEHHGADGYLAKPFDLDALLALVARFTAARPPEP